MTIAISLAVIVFTAAIVVRTWRRAKASVIETLGTAFDERNWH